MRGVKGYLVLRLAFAHYHILQATTHAAKNWRYLTALSWGCSNAQDATVHSLDDMKDFHKRQWVFSSFKSPKQSSSNQSSPPYCYCRSTLAPPGTITDDAMTHAVTRHWYLIRLNPFASGRLLLTLTSLIVISVNSFQSLLSKGEWNISVYLLYLLAMVYITQNNEPTTCQRTGGIKKKWQRSNK